MFVQFLTPIFTYFPTYISYNPVSIFSTNLLLYIVLTTVLLHSSVADLHPHDFGLLNLHPESAFQMWIPEADLATQKIVHKFELLIRSSILPDKKLKFSNMLLLFKKSVYFLSLKNFNSIT
jgi:hypothetical protein